MKALTDRLPQTPEAKREAAVQQEILELGASIRAARLARSWSQAQLAEHSGVTQADISRIENGIFQQGPTTVTLCRIAQALGMRLALGQTEPVKTQAMIPILAQNAAVQADLARLVEDLSVAIQHGMVAK